MAYKNLFDENGRPVRVLVANEKEDGAGEWHVPIVASDGKLLAKVAIDQTTPGTTNRVALDLSLTSVRDSLLGKMGAVMLRTWQNGRAKWSKEGDNNSQLRYSDWTAWLYGGVQTGSDWAAVHIPVDDLPVPDMDELIYRYYLAAAQAAGLAVCFATYNPDDHSERAEISQTAGVPPSEKDWNFYTIDPTTPSMFWYGNNVVSDLVEGAPCTWAQFQADKAFKNHVIYMIKLEQGYWGAGTAGDCWVSGVKLNGVDIPIEPSLNEQLDMLREQRQAPILHRNNISAQDLLATPATPSAADVATGGSLLFNTNYKFRVSAVNDNGVTVASVVDNITTADDASNTHVIRLTITRVTGAKKYNIFLSVDADPKYNTIVNDPGTGTTFTADVTATGTGAVSVTAGFAWTEPASSAGIDCAGYEGVDFDCKITLAGTSPVIELTPIYYDSVDAQWYAGESNFFTGTPGGGTVIRGKLRIRTLAKGAIVFLQVRSLTGTTPTFTLSVWASKF